jgi:hypothetical protein
MFKIQSVRALFSLALAVCLVSATACSKSSSGGSTGGGENGGGKKGAGANSGAAGENKSAAELAKMPSFKFSALKTLRPKMPDGKTYDWDLIDNAGLWRDNATGLVWYVLSPAEYKEVLKFQDAQGYEFEYRGRRYADLYRASRVYCQGLKYLKLKWDTPSASFESWELDIEKAQWNRTQVEQQPLSNFEPNFRQVNEAQRHGMISIFDLNKKTGTEYWFTANTKTHELYETYGLQAISPLHVTVRSIFRNVDAGVICVGQ